MEEGKEPPEGGTPTASEATAAGASDEGTPPESQMAATEASPGLVPAPEAPASPAASAPEAPTSPAASAPEAPPASQDGSETIEDPEIVESKRPPPSHVVSHHPPPPPRLRAGATSQPGRRLQVTGEPKLARDLMTRQLFTIGPGDSLQSLEEHMAAFRFRHLPVIEGNTLVGLISHSDLLHASTSFLSANAAQENLVIHKVPASRIMRKDFVTVRPTEPLASVAARLWEERVGCVLVTEEGGTLVGIITEADFVRLAHHFLARGEATPA